MAIRSVIIFRGPYRFDLFRIKDSILDRTEVPISTIHIISVFDEKDLEAEEGDQGGDERKRKEARQCEPHAVDQSLPSGRLTSDSAFGRWDRFPRIPRPHYCLCIMVRIVDIHRQS